ncbi:hypothetical protein OSB04_010525 [Centaurea solstitialis]|uniref:Uncharacterized protein n=1 Tax=Centaurea solstitialis TaxID=347529 RepID=A0AA38TIJ4_9ASTR|nr:hypothetical protein OSB04_010525 [Centaurea solstitialis]
MDANNKVVPIAIGVANNASEPVPAVISHRCHRCHRHHHHHHPQSVVYPASAPVPAVPAVPPLQNIHGFVYAMVGNAQNRWPREDVVDALDLKIYFSSISLLILHKISRTNHTTKSDLCGVKSSLSHVGGKSKTVEVEAEMTEVQHHDRFISNDENP